MAVVAVYNASSVKIQYDLGTGIDGKRQYKYKTYGSIASGSTNEKIMLFARGVEALQEHTIRTVKRYEHCSLAE